MLTTILAIYAAVVSTGALLQSILSFRKSGWNLEVIAYWDIHDNVARVEITNTGRQSCLVSEVRYFISSLTSSPRPGLDRQVFFDHDALTDPIPPSAKVELTWSIENLPEAFTLEVWVWAGGRAYKSQKWKVDPRTVEWK